MSNYCTKTYDKDTFDIFKDHARLIINGASASGKTRLCIDLILKYSEKFDKIIIADSPNANEFEEGLLNLKDKLEIYNYIPSISEINVNFTGHKLIILDDNYMKAFSSETVLKYYISGRHNGISPLIICQNLFFTKSKYSRDISLNVTHFIFLKLRDLNQIEYLSRQIFGKEDSKRVLEVYKFIRKKDKYGHLLIDISQSSNTDTDLRSNIINSGDIPYESCFKMIN